MFPLWQWGHSQFFQTVHINKHALTNYLLVNRRQQVEQSLLFPLGHSKNNLKEENDPNLCVKLVKYKGVQESKLRQERKGVLKKTGERQGGEQPGGSEKTDLPTWLKLLVRNLPCEESQGKKLWEWDMKKPWQLNFKVEKQSSSLCAMHWIDNFDHSTFPPGFFKGSGIGQWKFCFYFHRSYKIHRRPQESQFIILCSRLCISDRNHHVSHPVKLSQL